MPQRRPKSRDYLHQTKWIHQFYAMKQDSGFAMAMAMALGLCMVAVATTTILMAQENRDNAALRQESAASLLISDSAIAEVLTALSQKENAVLLGQNYDPINPKTNSPYLGNDGIPNSGDEKTSPTIDEWTPPPSYQCQSELKLPPHNLNFLSNSFSADSSYKVLAYRYVPKTKIGHLLVEGTHKGIPSIVHVSLEIAHNSTGFPGVLSNKVIYWQGRSITGTNSSVYFNPTDNEYPDRLRNLALDASVTRNDTKRESYLNMLWSGAADGFPNDRIEGDLVACAVNFKLPNTAKGEKLGPINNSLQLIGISGGKDVQTDGIDLEGNEELKVDTTDGPVHIYVQGTTQLSGSAKIRNYRRDGKRPQVGDLRIIQTLRSFAPIKLNHQSCIENAFLYSPEVDVHLFTSGSGCPSQSESNILGVVWAEDIENSTASQIRNDFRNQNDMPILRQTNSSTSDEGGTAKISFPTSGIEVPEDVSSLLTEVKAMNLPILYRINSVKAWNNVSI